MNKPESGLIHFYSPLEQFWLFIIHVDENEVFVLIDCSYVNASHSSRGVKTVNNLLRENFQWLWRKA